MPLALCKPAGYQALGAAVADALPLPLQNNTIALSNKVISPQPAAPTPTIALTSTYVPQVSQASQASAEPSAAPEPAVALAVGVVHDFAQSFASPAPITPLALQPLVLPHMEAPSLAISLPAIALPNLSLPSISIPAIALPKLSMPSIAIPSLAIALPKLPQPDLTYLQYMPAAVAETSQDVWNNSFGVVARAVVQKHARPSRRDAINRIKRA